MQDRTGKVMKGNGSQLLEIAASRDDEYDRLLCRATKALGMKTEGKRFGLFKPNTAKVPNAKLSVKSCERKWTLGNYLLAVKKAPSQIKFGVGCVEGHLPDRVSCIVQFANKKYELTIQRCLAAGIGPKYK